ncbi:hypothetical protein [Brevibacillus massiliensis]|jgi:uncharacterized protein involved in response to NO|uniref:hypothetical protein n=1 Tax=Brevibacillus massiliensis TaxID=1118054 RepID=UPI000311EA2F|nr:hypothetical protein [Brevibacillus massiliensis]
MPTRIHPLILLLLILAAIGFIFQLVTNPLQILLTIAMIGLILFFVNNYLKTGRFLPRKPALKRSAKQPAKHVRSPARKSAASRRDHPFQVIEGNKGKQKGEDEDGRGQEPKMYH